MSLEASSKASEVHSHLEQAEDAYLQLRSRRVDLVGDYAGSELFLIEGDSLLRRAFEDERLDFDHGFQLLHSVYNVERILNALIQRKCHFHVVFFTSNKHICYPLASDSKNFAKYDLARLCIIRHLETHLNKTNSDILINTFQSIEHEDFKIYLKKVYPYFVMCHDGASPQHQFGVVNGSDSTSKMLQKSLRSMIIDFVSHGLDVALINGLEWKDTKVMATVLERYRSHQTWIKPFRFTPPVTKHDIDIGEDAFRVLSQGHKLSNRQLLTVLAANSQLQCLPKEVSYVEALKLTQDFLVHMSLLEHVTLADRHVEMPKGSENAKIYLRAIAELMGAILGASEWSQYLHLHPDDNGLADCIDGRLFLHVTTEVPSLDENVKDTLGKLSSAMCSLHIESYKVVMIESQKTTRKPPLVDGPHLYGTGAAVLPFSNPVFDKHLTSVRLLQDKEYRLEPDSTEQRVFAELTHWHNANKPLVQKGVSAQDERTKKRIMRNHYRQMAEMRNYAASLTNAVGRQLEPETIIEKSSGEIKQSKKPQQKNTQPPKHVDHSGINGNTSKSSGGGKQKKSSGRDKVLQQIEAGRQKKRDEASIKAIRSWANMCKTFDAERGARSRYEQAKKYLHGLALEVCEYISAEIKLYMAVNLSHCWIDKSIDKSEELPAQIWDLAKQIKEDQSLTDTIETHIDRIISLLNLPTLARSHRQLCVDRKLSFPCMIPSQLSNNKQLLESQQFQLLLAGPFMERSLDASEDARVDFKPDGWQRQVLDVIDARQSLFVVAPTSAGKTYASFYAMKQILEEDSDGVICYVAPTKALVNQIAAEIQARFSKNFKHPGKSVWAIHTRDYRINNPTGCQVLVTVPHVLQIMLLAPINANAWSMRLRRIIFDEIHSIGNAEDGLVWEQLLLMAPCPIMALSATVGNPEQFSEWLSSTQNTVGNELVTVVHPHRYSDLRKYVYKQQRDFIFTGLPAKGAFGGLSLEGSASFDYIHPVASLIDVNRGIPQDLNLEPRDCLLLWRSMIKHQNTVFQVPQDLAPHEALPDIIRKADILNWEVQLKNLLTHWMLDSESPYDDVVEDLSPVPQDEHKVGDDETAIASKVDPCQTALPMLCALHSQNALPVLMFSFDRHQCELIAFKLLNDLKQGENDQITSRAAWQKKLEAWEQWKINAAKIKSQAERRVGKKSRKKGTEDEEGYDVENDLRTLDSSSWAAFDPDAPQPGYHFADYSKVQALELKEYTERMARFNIAPRLIEALQRGIGVHHSGMNRKYRQVVEILFRKRFLQVVIATGTLALGINMPAKTVVFSGDSVFLTALNYRQCAGRAGRRGFDLLGNVVFHGVPNHKVLRLMSSRLPDLNGHFPITTSLVLRMFTLLHGSKNAKYAVSAINGLLSQPRLYLGGPSFEHAAKHHLRFSIEYLRRQHFLDGNGIPINFAGLVNHLYFAEPDSFAFTALLQSGYLHNLCADVHHNEPRVLETLMLVLAHIFKRIYLRQADNEDRSNLIKGSSSIVFLPPLPQKAAKVLSNHNKQTLHTFKNYVNTFIEQHIAEPDARLPVTGLYFGSHVAPKSFDMHIRKAKIVSPFIALSGFADEDIITIHELCETVRAGVFLEEGVIPFIPVDDENEHPLNAWLLDFYKHGDISALEKANRIRRGDVWFYLKDFSLCLAAIITAMQNYLRSTGDEDASLSMLDVVDVEDTNQLQVEESEDANGGKEPDTADSVTDDASMDDTVTDSVENLHQGLDELDIKETGLRTVLYALQKLNAEFTAKFQAIYA